MSGIGDALVHVEFVSLEESTQSQYISIVDSGFEGDKCGRWEGVGLEGLEVCVTGEAWVVS